MAENTRFWLDEPGLITPEMAKALRQRIEAKDARAFARLHLQQWPDPDAPPSKSWWCEPCAVEVHDRRCVHCGKLKSERA